MAKTQVGKTVLVTGASSGFGRLSVECLAREGNAVFAGMRETSGRNAAVADELRALAQQENVALTVVELDVTDEASVANAVRLIVSGDRPIDVLVNNAGLLCFGLAESILPDQFREIFDVNVIGPHRLCRAVLPCMRRRGSGLIIQISSVLGRYTLPCYGVYCASKSALEALTECMRDELAGSGVDVVLVEPGAYPTGLANKIIGPADPGRSVGYPAAESLAKRLRERFAALTSGPDAPAPGEVAAAIARLIGLPPGSRPMRTVVGRDVQETHWFNEAAEEFRRRAVAEMGL